MSYSRILILAAALGLASLLQAQDGPSHVVVTYRIYPDKRTAFRTDLNNQTPRLARWRDDGLIGGLQVLMAALIDDEAWEAIFIAKSGTRGLEQFKRFEQPGGVAIATSVPVDLAASGGEVPRQLD